MTTYARFPGALITHIVTPDGTRLECSPKRGANQAPFQALTARQEASLCHSDCGTCVVLSNNRLRKSQGLAWRGNPITALQIKKLVRHGGYAASEVAELTQGKAADVIDTLGTRQYTWQSNPIIGAGNGS